ncbi:MAG: hypothetical protein PVH17_00930, partial [Anaerolineae bacterium]
RKKWREKVQGFEHWEEAVSTFGKRSSEGYQQLRVQRETLIRQVLGTTDDMLPSQQFISQQSRR